MSFWPMKRTVQLVYAFRRPDGTWFTDPASRHMVPATCCETEVCDPLECIRTVRYGTFPVSVRSHPAPVSIWMPHSGHPQRRRAVPGWTHDAEREFFLTPPF